MEVAAHAEAVSQRGLAHLADYQKFLFQIISSFFSFFSKTANSSPFMELKLLGISALR
jgi:hypothetical protein